MFSKESPFFIRTTALPIDKINIRVVTLKSDDSLFLSCGRIIPPLRLIGRLAIFVVKTRNRGISMANISISKDKMGEMFRLRRRELSLRQEDVANQAGLSVSTVSNLELGNHTIKQESILACAQVLGIADGLFGLLSEAEQKEQTVKQELEKIEKITHANPDEALKQLAQLNEDYNLENTRTLLPLANYLWGKCYFEKRKWPKAEKFLQAAVSLIEEQLEQNEELKNSNILAACYNDLARISYFQSDLKQSLQFVDNGLTTFVLHGDRLYHWYFLLLNRCLYLQKMNHLEKAMEALEQLQIHITNTEQTATKFQNVRLTVIIQFYDIYANVLNEMGMTEKALEYAKMGINIAWLNQEYDKLLTLWITIGTIYFSKGNLLTAKEYFLQALYIQPKVEQEHLLIPAYTNLGQVYLQQSEPKTAREYVNKALTISQKHNNVLRQVEVLQALGYCFSAQELYDEAIAQFEQGRQLANSHGLLDQELDLLDNMCDSYEKIGNTTKFLECAGQTYRIRQKLKEFTKRGML
jgi:tetratricopeptide (TPR) repeat protein